MLIFILVIFILIVICVILGISFTEDSGNKFALSIVLFVASFFVGILLAAECEELRRNKDNTLLIRRYQQGDYSLELRVGGDKIDTVYIFK